MVVRLGAKANGSEILEAVGQVGVIGRVHGRVGSVGGILPVGGAEELVELNRAATDSAEPGNEIVVSQSEIRLRAVCIR